VYSAFSLTYCLVSLASYTSFHPPSVLCLQPLLLSKPTYTSHWSLVPVFLSYLSWAKDGLFKCFCFCTLHPAPISSFRAPTPAYIHSTFFHAQLIQQYA
jgi:hypothetical protein